MLIEHTDGPQADHLRHVNRGLPALRIDLAIEASLGLGVEAHAVTAKHVRPPQKDSGRYDS